MNLQIMDTQTRLIRLRQSRNLSLTGLALSLTGLMNSNSAKCPNCDKSISNIHYEAHDPDSLSGYRGSASFTAVAHPCGHALGAVPMTWEMRLEEIDRLIRELNQKLDGLYKEIGQLSASFRKSNIRTR